MRTLLVVTLAFAALEPVHAQIEVGQGAPAGVAQKFVSAFFRNGFNGLVNTPPLGQVRRYGSTGYIQEFSALRSGTDSSGNATTRFALVKADDSAGISTEFLSSEAHQMYPALFSYYSTVGVANAGYPEMDTARCPVAGTTATTVCTYAIFSNNYALFVNSSSITAADSSASYTVKDLIYLRWAALGGITAFGPPASAESAITSRSAITANTQVFTNGAVYSITSGAHNGKVYAVGGKIFTLYNTNGLHTGSLGLPLSDELSAGGGRFRQTFEGGSIEYTATTDAVIRPSVGAVTLSISTSAVTRINVGETLAIRASVIATTGEPLTDRQVSWVTSNGRVIGIQSNGLEATLRAVGGGTAIINAVSDGKASASLNVFVAAPCCQIGEGAPTAAIQQSFQDTVTRFRLNIKLPAANPVRRVGTGYVQDLVSSDNPDLRYLLCRSDRSPGVFVVTGGVLTAYEKEGGPSGRLAYPTADEAPAGRQMFEGGALAGRPVYTVTEPLLTRWAASNYEAGPLGPPVSVAGNSLSFTGATGTGQSFRSGFLFRILTGPNANARILLVQGPILAAYAERNGPAGALGFPVNDAYAADGGMQQDFEGGSLKQRPTGEVETVERDRKPEVSVSPSRVTAGGRVRIIVGGFPNGARLRVSFNASPAIPAFEIQTTQGSYTWEVPVPANATTSSVLVTARDMGSEVQAAGSYSITALNESAVRLTKLRGDTQTGIPGALLARPLVASLVDESGNPLAGIPVRFAASPGSKVETASSVTDANGEATATVRLVQSDGIALVTADAGGKVVTFSARSSGASLTNYPKQNRMGTVVGSARETMLAAVSSILRFYQNRNELPSSLGLADPAQLGAFLNDFCVFDSSGGRICDGFVTFQSSLERLPNLYRLKDFVGNNLDVEVMKTDEAAILDALAQNSPVLLALAVSDGAGVRTAHFVVANGVSGDGDVLIADPEPSWNRSRLVEYTFGFMAGGVQLKAEVLGAVRLHARSASPTGFVVTAYPAAVQVRSEKGDCAAGLNFPLTDGRGGRPAGQAGIYYCPGQEAAQLVSFDASGPYEAVLTDLGTPGRRNEIRGAGQEAYSATRPQQWVVNPAGITLSSAGVVNAATLTAELAPGSLAVITGTGLAREGAETIAELDEDRAVVQMATPFRLNVEIPMQAAAGDHTLRITSPFGTVTAAVRLSPVAPALYRVIVNAAGGATNSPFNPVTRGSAITLYATGLGAVRRQGNQDVVTEPVTVLLQGAEVPASFAGPASNLPGTYVINVTTPAGVAPGLDIPVSIRQGGVESNAVPLSVR
ncbi:MAG: Ig-like domain-containing protein [Bryobacterales bacterium]|nr:Ig-like domain-containing protein [Bryobacterales bacterium]